MSEPTKDQLSAYSKLKQKRFEVRSTVEFWEEQLEQAELEYDDLKGIGNKKGSKQELEKAKEKVERYEQRVRLTKEWIAKGRTGYYLWMT